MEPSKPGIVIEVTSARILARFIAEEVWRCVSNSAGLVGGMNIGKYSGEFVGSPSMNSLEEEDEEQENNGQDRERRQDVAPGPR